MRKFCLFISLLLLLAACGDREVAVRLSVVDSLMDSRADSALAVLNDWQDEAAGWSRGQRMRYALLRAKAQNKAGVDFTSDSTMLRVVSYYDGWLRGTAHTILGHSAAVHNDRLLSHYLLGCVYRDLGQVPRAIDCYLNAIAQADTTAADCDFGTLGRVYTQMAELYHKQLLLSNEVSARWQARQCFLCAKDTLNAIYHLGMIAGTYIIMNERDCAEILLRETIAQYLALGDEQNALLTSTTLMYLYIDQPSHLSDLKQLINRYDTKSDFFNGSHELPPSKRQFYYYKGKYFEDINRLDSAEYYYRKVYRPNMAYSSLNPMYKGLLSVFSKRHQADSIAKYAKLYCLSTDSSVIIKDQQQTAQLSASYDYHYYKELSLENENKALWAFLAFAITFVSLIVLTFGGVYLVKRFRHAQYQLYRFHLEYEEELMQIHQREKDELQRGYLSKQEQTKQEYEQKLAKLQLRQEKELTLAKKREVSRNYFNHEVVRRAIRIANDPRQSLTEKAFDDLLLLTYEHFPLMRQELEQSEGITIQMERVLVLSILGVRVEDIGRLLKVSPQRITNLRGELSLILFGKKTARQFESRLCSHFGVKTV